MKSRSDESAPGDRHPHGAKANAQSNGTEGQASASAVELQGSVAVLERGAISARIIFGGTRGLVFAKSPDGLLRQVADILVGEVGR